ncbi:LOW QUALITY PROTEIN: UBX domain-containing protein 4-like [Amphiura filiformis]|uniref:LOW QUALITY PROTEIN: UBX domain-containing protein 4-like n=1 Tax=Amphiura filiformis TaxID=82378 RepID=UPI003B216039
MRWFEGAITAAITEAKQRRVLFVVYIHGDDDDDSKKMDDTWEDTAVTNVCEETQLIAMRFNSNSEECKQFSQFYPVLCVPSVSLISGETGVPLEGVAGYVTPDEFADKIRKVNQNLKQQSSASQSPPVSDSSSPSVPQADSSPSAPPNKEASSSQAASSPQSKEETKENLQDRAARLRHKMEAIHQQKEAQKKEEIRKKEMERRKMGQGMQKMKQQRAEQEARELAAEIRKEKLEDKLAKERVKEQISRDRAEKNSRFAEERREREQSKAVKETAKQATKTEEQKVKAKVNMEIARLQFRLPDGSTVTQQFPSSSHLQEAHDFLAEHVGNSLKDFTLSTTFPRRRFAASDLSRSLLNLELAPSAAIVVLPGMYQSTRASAAVAASSGGGGILMWILGPLLFIWNAFYNFLFGSSGSASDSDQSPPPQEQTIPQSAAAGARPKSSNVRRRTPGGEGSSYQRDGNIHRLVSNSDEDEDDNNTWNGNSTQQM